MHWRTLAQTMARLVRCSPALVSNESLSPVVSRGMSAELDRLLALRGAHRWQHTERQHAMRAARRQRGEARHTYNRKLIRTPGCSMFPSNNDAPFNGQRE